MNEPETTHPLWVQGLDRELAFWRSYLSGGGLWEPDAFRFRFDPDAPLQDHIAARLPGDVPACDLQILDCAAGPATTLGKTLRSQRLQITAIDALATSYAAILHELGLTAPVPTQQGDVEHLDELFPPDRFSLVYMRFALDHVYDPVRALRQMVRVARPGGVVMIEHYRDERDTEYAGLKQWTLLPVDADLIIYNPRDRISVRDAIADAVVDVTATPDWLTVTLTRASAQRRSRDAADRV